MAETVNLIDAKNRKLEYQELDLMDEMNLMAAAGGDLSGNRHWMLMARLVSSVRAVDGVPVPFPVDKKSIDAAAKRVGSDGLAAINEHYTSSKDSPETAQSEQQDTELTKN